MLQNDSEVAVGCQVDRLPETSSAESWSRNEENGTCLSKLESTHCDRYGYV